MLINKREGLGLKYCDDCKLLVVYLNDMEIFLKTLKRTIQIKKNKKILIVFDDMLAEMLTSKKLQPMIRELLLSGRKLNISLAFYHAVLFCCAKKY